MEKTNVHGKKQQVHVPLTRSDLIRQTLLSMSSKAQAALILEADMVAVAYRFLLENVLETLTDKGGRLYSIRFILCSSRETSALLMDHLFHNGLCDFVATNPTNALFFGRLCKVASRSSHLSRKLFGCLIKTPGTVSLAMSSRFIVNDVLAAVFQTNNPEVDELVSTWNQLEPTKESYDLSELLAFCSDLVWDTISANDKYMCTIVRHAPRDCFDEKRLIQLFELPKSED